MPISEAKKQADKRYREKAISRITLDFKTEFKEDIVVKAKEKGLSTQGYIRDLIEKDMKIDPSTLDEPILEMIYNHPELIDIMKIISSLPLSAQKEIAENLRHQAKLLKDENK